MELQDVVLVIGGDGFLGRYIVENLLAIPSVTVKVFDRQQRYTDVPYIIGDVTDYASLASAMTSTVPNGRNVSAVIHTVAATPGAPGHIHKLVSVQGTRNVIKACLEAGVKKLVYTSSSSVVYSGADVVNGNETMPYSSNHVDEYTQYKAEAEEMVLKVNGTNGLYTCAIRPCGMFGPRDMLLTAKMINAAEMGQVRAQIGDNKNLVDFTFIENISYAHLLALQKLSPDSPVGGEAFNITNGEPIAFWDFPRAMWASCGFQVGKPIVIPYLLGYCLAALVEFLAWILSPFVKVPTTFTRFYVKFMKVNRYYSIQKAIDLLGYQPPVSLDEALEKTGEWYKVSKKQNATAMKEE